MTRLTKEVRRLTHTLHRGREIIVAMRPPDMLTFRLKGTRHIYPLNIVSAFDLAQKVEAYAALKKWKADRDARQKARRAERRQK